MRPGLHPAYRDALLVSVSLQVSLLAFLFFYTDHLIFRFATIPAAAYCVITPIIIFRRPQPTGFDIQMVRSGYFFYFLLAILMALAYGAWPRWPTKISAL